MELTYAELSSPGPVRDLKVDFLSFWQPADPDQREYMGAVVALADGEGQGYLAEEAGRSAAETALAVFREPQENRAPQQLLARMFSAANTALHDRPEESEFDKVMTAALSLVILQGDQIVVGNVGGSRVYLVRGGEIRQLSVDDTYSEVQQMLGLVDGEEGCGAKPSVLTNSLGRQSAIRIEPETVAALNGDIVILCSDGLHRHVSDGEILERVSTLSPAQACRQLVAVAEGRGTDDSVSIQVIRIDAVKKPSTKSSPPQPSEQPKTAGYDLQPGQTLDERFFITETISRSGMATIFKATDLLTNEDVAIKVPFLQFESDPGFYSRFVREGEIGERLHHPYILRFLPVELRSRPYLVTEYLRGYTLAHLLKSVCPLPEKDALALASRICEALCYLHEHGVIHRDLKPQNIMICQDGSIRILDFGIARSTGRRFTFSGFTPAMGTPEYMAPEQVKGRRGDQRTDIYSLGAILYEMCVGKLPFADGKGDVFAAMNARVTGDPVAPRKLNRELTEQAEEIILHAMEREPKNRYESAMAMKAELDDPAAVPLTGRWRTLQAPALWKRHLKSGILLGIVLLGILFGFIKLILMIIHRGP